MIQYQIIDLKPEIKENLLLIIERSLWRKTARAYNLLIFPLLLKHQILGYVMKVVIFTTIKSSFQWKKNMIRGKRVYTLTR